ncbi:MAG: ABC transporter ATP-binding protein [Chloroflexi bacterium]|nr:ABC transporter ATP-binding protein [Chloroflexota bacterium]MCL5074986.1 ABC transporter ATP-binding protein [Chloroflexota bacterium]
MALLEVNNLTKRFGGLVANDRINVEVNQGEIVGMIGPNGAGKTTLFNCIAGFYRPDEGSVRFDRQMITGYTPERICQLGLARTFQIMRIFKDMTVLENVMVGGFCHTADAKQTRKTALEVLEFVGLADKQSILGANLTTADKKRLEVARALATRPKLLMLDEAMAGLNPKEQQEAVELIYRLRDRGITLFLVEHVMEVIMPISDRVLVLDYGKKIAEGMPQEIAQNEDVIRAYLGDRYHAAS